MSKLFGVNVVGAGLERVDLSVKNEGSGKFAGKGDVGVECRRPGGGTR